MNATFGRKRLVRWGAGVTLAGFLIGGGIALAASSGSPSAAGTDGQASEATTLNSVLDNAASTTAAVPAARVRGALARLRALGGIEGQATFHNKTGFHTLAFERGTIQSVSGGNVVVKSADGTTWTWVIVKDTVVRKNGAKATTSALSAGETVLAAGPVVGGAKDARLIVIRTGSESAQTSLS